MKVLLKLVVLAAIASIPALQPPSTHGAEHAYVGSKKCRPCHIKEYRAWANTKMASALDILKPGQREDVKESHGLDPNKDYSTDSTCLPCHTTGYGKQGGFVDMKTTPDLAGIGCEMCHGPGGTYVADEYMSLKNKNYKKADLLAVGLAEVGEQTCIGQCHNENNPTNPNENFDYATRKNDGIHQIFPLKYKHE
jgi:hypothetical protein